MYEQIFKGLPSIGSDINIKKLATNLIMPSIKLIHSPMLIAGYASTLKFIKNE